MPRTLTRGAVVAAGALLALPLIAAPAQAWTDRVETRNRGTSGGAEESVAVDAPVSVGARSSLRYTVTAPYAAFWKLGLRPRAGGPVQELFFVAVPRTTTSFLVKLGDTAPGEYDATAYALTNSGESGVAYTFPLTVTDAAAATVRPSLAGRATLRVYGGGDEVRARGGDTVRYVAPAGYSFARAGVKIGPAPADGQPGVATPSPGVTLKRAADGKSLTVTVPREVAAGQPVTRRGTPLNVLITVPDAPTNHGAGGVYLYGRLLVDPAGTRWYAPTGPAAATDTLLGQQGLRVGASLTSANGRYRLVQQADRNLVVYRLSDGRALWSSGKHGAVVTELQQDGTLVQRGYSGNVVWSNGRAGSAGGAHLVMQGDSNLVAYGYAGKVLWSSGIAR